MRIQYQEFCSTGQRFTCVTAFSTYKNSQARCFHFRVCNETINCYNFSLAIASNVIFLGGEKINYNIKRHTMILSTLLITILALCFFASTQISAGDRRPSVKVDYLSIPAAAFQPVTKDSNVTISGSIGNQGTQIARLVAPVELPNGATITNVTSYWFDNSPPSSIHISCFLYGEGIFEGHFGIFGNIADVSSTGNTQGVGSTSDTTIAFATINNKANAYFVELHLPPNSDTIRYWFVYITIEYTMPI